MIYAFRPQIPNIRLAYFESYVDPRLKQFSTSLKYVIRSALPEIKLSLSRLTQDQTSDIILEDEHKRLTRKANLNLNTLALKPIMPAVKTAWSTEILNTLYETQKAALVSRRSKILTEYYKSTDNLVMFLKLTKIEKVGD